MTFQFKTLLLTFLCFSSSHSSPLSIATVFPKFGEMSGARCISNALVKDFEEQENLEIILYSLDSGNDLRSISHAAKVIDEKRPTVVVGTRTSQEALLLSDLIKETPFLVPMASHPDITLKRRNTYRLISSSKTYGTLMARHISSVVKGKTLLIIDNLSLPYSTYYSKLVRKEVLKLKEIKNIVTVKILSSQTQFREISEILTKNPHIHGIYMPVYTSEFTRILSALPKLKRPLEIFSQGGAIDGKDIIRKSLQKNPNFRVTYNGIWSGKIDGGLSPLYKHLMKTKCPTHKHGYRTVSAFDSTYWALESIKAKSVSQALFKKALLSPSFDGVLGKVRLDKYRNNPRPLFLHTISSESKGVHKKVVGLEK